MEPGEVPLPRLLDGRFGIVLGLSTANGHAAHCAAALHKMGAEVAVTFRPSRGEAARDLAASLGCALAIELDADRPETVVSAFAELSRAWPRLDFLVHTLMSVPPAALAKPLIEVERADFEHVLAIGVHSLIAACRQALPLLRRGTAPRIVTLTSPAWHRATRGFHVAAINEAALVATVRQLALELGPDGVLCNAVSASALPTDGALRTVGNQAIEAAVAAHARRGPTRRPSSFRDVAVCVGWLCSAHAGNLTGEVVTVDGGFSRVYL